MTSLAQAGRKLLYLAAFTTSLVGSRAEAEIIGIWDVVAPISASLVSGTTTDPFFFWLNVVDAPVTIEEAFTGHSILDDGYANFTVNTVVELGFAADAAENISGPDLVLFDGRFDANAFAVSTSYDGFLSEISLTLDLFVNTFEMRQYFFGNPEPNTATIWDAPFDLSDLGVPEGASVGEIRVRYINEGGGDLIGVGSLTGTQPVPEPTPLPLLILATAALLPLAARR